MIDRSDVDRLAAAAASGRVLYTFNVADYCVLQQAWILNGGLTPGSSLRHSSATQPAKSFGDSCG
jgi:hypothetical protein